MILEKSIISLNDIDSQITNDYQNGHKVGTSTYFSEIDSCWKWRTGEFNLWTGYMGEGKSELLKQLCITKALKEGKKFAFFSPENMPANEFFMELMFPLTGLNPYRHNRYFNMTEGDFNFAKEFINKHFFLVYPKSRDIKEIEQNFLYLKEKENIYGAILDPFLKINHGRETSADYIANFMAERADFSKSADISYNLVAHQLTPIIENGNYVKPDPYRIKGGGNFADGADNVLIVWRPNKKSNKSDSVVHFESAKIKRYELVSSPNDTLLNFEKETKWYKQMNGYNPIKDYWNKMNDLKEPVKVQKDTFDIKKAINVIDQFNDDAPF
jgi:twinkle protein